jgi:hypothetical protein
MGSMHVGILVLIMVKSCAQLLSLNIATVVAYSYSVGVEHRDEPNFVLRSQFVH